MFILGLNITKISGSDVITPVFLALPDDKDKPSHLQEIRDSGHTPGDLGVSVIFDSMQTTIYLNDDEEYLKYPSVEDLFRDLSKVGLNDLTLASDGFNTTDINERLFNSLFKQTRDTSDYNSKAKYALQQRVRLVFEDNEPASKFVENLKITDTSAPTNRTYVLYDRSYPSVLRVRVSPEGLLQNGYSPQLRKDIIEAILKVKDWENTP